jgi:hypothetical protein
MSPDESFLLHEFEGVNEAQKARQSKIAQAAITPGIRLTAVSLKDTGTSKLYGIYEPPIVARREEGTHLQRRDSPR